MGMTGTVEIVDEGATRDAIERVFSYFTYVDDTFSTYKATSEIMAINRGELKREEWSDDMKEVFALSEETKRATKGYFNIQKPDGSYDPSGLVKGWAIRNAARILDQEGFENFYIDVGGDIEFRGKNALGKIWSSGIRNPFKQDEIVKVVYLSNRCIATSGTSMRGQHIYDPHHVGPLEDIVSLTVIGKDVYEADRFATAAFAMGRQGIYFLESVSDLEGYMIDKDGEAVATSGFEAYTKSP